MGRRWWLIDDLRKLAWSRLGCIAYISQDARQVNVRHLMCNPSDGKWILSDDYPLSQIADAHSGQPLIHLSWNENGADLAVADVSGRVSIFSISMALNNIVINRQATLDQSDDGAQIVGMMWLNANRAVCGARTWASSDLTGGRNRCTLLARRRNSMAAGVTLLSAVVPSVLFIPPARPPSSA